MLAIPELTNALRITNSGPQPASSESARNEPKESEKFCGGRIKVALADLKVKGCKLGLQLSALRKTLERIQASTAESKRVVDCLAANPSVAVFGHGRDNVPNAEEPQHLHERQQAQQMELEKEREMRQNTKVLEIKGREYLDRIHNLQRQLEHDRDRDWTLDGIEQMHRDVSESLRSLDSKRDVLAGYEQLPPDMNLAQMKLAEKKLELSHLIQQKDKMLKTMMG